ncbi:MAG: hypothetical protein ACPGQT_07280 [Rhodothermales bacterium]
MHTLLNVGDARKSLGAFHSSLPYLLDRSGNAAGPVPEIADPSYR